MKEISFKELLNYMLDSDSQDVIAIDNHTKEKYRVCFLPYFGAEEISYVVELYKKSGEIEAILDNPFDLVWINEQYKFYKNVWDED